jgi:SAM-dependent methyltransferase
MNYAPADYWNQFFDQRRLSGDDLDWGQQWVGAFLEPLRQAQVRTLLDLGCGTGNEVLNLARAGFEVTGLDYSQKAIGWAQAKAKAEAAFMVADMAKPLPFPNAGFDAVMSNVAMHMFSDTITQALFSEVRRIVRPNGLFLFHLNALEDRPFRAQRKPPIRELEPNYILEQDGQTMRFFSQEYLLELLSGWREVSLEPVEIPAAPEMGYPPKRVWRGIIRL